MSQVVFVSDLHLGHRRILEHTADVPGAYRGGSHVDEHDEWVIEQCLSIGANKNTLWWLLGDLAMERDRLALLDRLPGRKMMVAGNHDDFHAAEYLEYVEDIHAIRKRYGMWITHAPLHPVELRGKPNLHGHCHHHSTRDDWRYFNACIEWLPERRPITLDELRSRWLRDAQDRMREAG